MLRFSSWIVLFFSSPLFMPCLLSRGPLLILTITIFLSWDPSHSPYALSNPYAVPCITTGQGILFAYLFLVMDNYSSSRFSRISCILLLLILFSMTFHDVLFLLSRSLLEYISPHTCTYSILMICTIHVSHLLCLESLAPRPNPPLSLVHLVAPELAKLLIIYISLCPILKDSLLFYLCLSLQVYVLL